MTERVCREAREAFRVGTLSDPQAEHVSNCPACQGVLESDAFTFAPPTLLPSSASVARIDRHLATLGAPRAPARLPWAWIVTLAIGLGVALAAGGRHPSPAPETRDAWRARPHTPLSPRELPAETVGEPRTAVRGVSE